MLSVKKVCKATVLGMSFVLLAGGIVGAQEVGKGKIPAAQLESSYTQLDWGVKIWDVDHAVNSLKSKDNVIWVDTRPESFFKKGTVRDAVLLVYNKKGAEENTLSAESLAAAVKAAGTTKENAKIAFFCQGPKCHRSYNASYVAVTEWGYPAENMIWFRAGYPYLLKEVQSNPKLKRKAKKYISDAGITQL